MLALVLVRAGEGYTDGGTGNAGEAGSVVKRVDGIKIYCPTSKFLGRCGIRCSAGQGSKSGRSLCCHRTFGWLAEASGTSLVGRRTF